jgi:valyl-tRNA synthetase
LALPAGHKDKNRALSVLVYVLDRAFRLAHPVMPFVTEELWQKLPQHPDWGTRPASICVAAFPEAKNMPSFENEAVQWKTIQDIVSGIRSVRSQMGLPPKQESPAHVRIDESMASTVTSAEEWIKRLGKADKLVSGPQVTRPGQSLSAVGKGFEVYLPVQGLIDVEKERKRLATEEQRLQKILDGIMSKLNNASFVDRAPEDVLAQNRAQKQNMEEQLSAIRTNLKALAD